MGRRGIRMTAYCCRACLAPRPSGQTSFVKFLDEHRAHHPLSQPQPNVKRSGRAHPWNGRAHAGSKDASADLPRRDRPASAAASPFSYFNREASHV